MNASPADGLLLGLVQGLTEFLPVSSSGHLVLAEALVKLDRPGLYFEIGLHVATLLSVLLAYRVRVADLARGVATGRRDAWRYVGLLALGSVPAGVVGLGFRDLVAEQFAVGPGLGLGFLLTAAVLLSTRFALPRATGGDIGPAAALGIGLAQAAALLPAVSRSGMTIAAALWVGIAPARAAEFSFLLGVVAIGGSALLEVRHLPTGGVLLEPVFLVAFAAALASGVWAIRWLVRLLDRGRFHHFAWYCAAVGLGTLLWSAFGR